MITHANTRLSGSTLKIDKNKVTALGPSLYLSDVTLENHAKSDDLIVAGMQMRGGVFDQHGELRDFHFQFGHFDSVAFRGRFSGVDFGAWDEADDASITACDFSDAVLLRCRFLRTDFTGFRWPKTTGFLILNPSQALSYVRARDWPPELGIDLEVSCDIDPECSAIAHAAADVAKGDGLDIAALFKLLSGLPGLQIYP